MDAVIAACLAAVLGARLFVKLRAPLGPALSAFAVAAGAAVIVATATEPAAMIAGTVIALAILTRAYAGLVRASLVDGLDLARGAAPVEVGLVMYLMTGRPLPMIVALAGACLAWALLGAMLDGLRIAAHDRKAPRPHVPFRGRARWKRLAQPVHDPAFWGVVVARPIARALLYPLAEQRWLTPNRITIVSVGCALGAAAAIVGGHVVLPIALIGVRSVLDSMDGQLARYRGCGTRLGSYADKVSDLLCWGGLYAALGARAFAATDDRTMLALPLLAAVVLATSAVAMWLAKAMVAGPVLPAPPARRASWASGLWRIVLFEEPDFYLWIALALATARFDVFVPLIAAGLGGRLVVLAAARARSFLEVLV